MFSRHTLIISCFFMSAIAMAQMSWERETGIFLKNFYKVSLEKLAGNTLDSAILNTTQLIARATDSVDKSTLAEVYGARGSLRFEKLKRIQSGLNSNMNVNGELVTGVEADYRKAAGICATCECTYLGYLFSYYEYLGNDAKLDEVSDRLRKLGDEDLPTAFGIGLHYLAPRNIVGAELTLFAFQKARQEKMIDPQTGKSFWPCGYQYPVAIGFLALGAETSIEGSFDLDNYSAVKFSPIWINAYASFRLSQFLFCGSKAGNSFVWRPEIGYSFSTLSINYAYNYAFNKSFTYLPSHSISIRYVIPLVKWYDDE
jgi:hypothetical protein